MIRIVIYLVGAEPQYSVLLTSTCQPLANVQYEMNIEKRPAWTLLEKILPPKKSNILTTRFRRLYTSVIVFFKEKDIRAVYTRENSPQLT